MALDRFIYWNEREPSQKDIETVLQDYLGGAGRVEWDGNRFYATLTGKPSFPFRRLTPELDHRREASESHDERWFEVYIHKGECVDVITRQTDEYTNNVAQGFAELLARYWEGRLEE